MTGRGVRAGTALLVALVVGGASWLLWELTTGEGSLVPRPSWLAATLLVAMAAFVLGFAWPVRAYLGGLPGIDEVHDLHIWGLSTTETAVTAHLVRRDATGDTELVDRICRDARDRFGIGHATLQVVSEPVMAACDAVGVAAAPAARAVPSREPQPGRHR